MKLIRLLNYSDCVVDFCPQCILVCHNVLTALNKMNEGQDLFCRILLFRS